MSKVTVRLAGGAKVICERYHFCEKGNKKTGLAKDDFGNLIPNKCGEWCCYEENCQHLCIAPTEETKISFAD